MNMQMSMLLYATHNCKQVWMKTNSEAEEDEWIVEQQHLHGYNSEW